MARQCHGICDTIKGIVHTSCGVGVAKKGYADGWKRCTICEYNISTIAIRCVCCKGVLRLKTRNTKPSKRKMIIND